MDVKEKAIIILEVYGLGELKFKSVEDLLDRVYKLAHVAHGTCGNPHEDWKQEVEEEYKRLEEADLL